ncbi:MAG: hypothetical protein KGJ35_03805 [Patescibacteria group bacterium]|nr:hypothetical protein [Patescibacteria group bacterium]
MKKLVSALCFMGFVATQSNAQGVVNNNPIVTSINLDQLNNATNTALFVGRAWENSWIQLNNSAWSSGSLGNSDRSPWASWSGGNVPASLTLSNGFVSFADNGNTVLPGSVRVNSLGPINMLYIGLISPGSTTGSVFDFFLTLDGVSYNISNSLSTASSPIDGISIGWPQLTDNANLNLMINFPGANGSLSGFSTATELMIVGIPEPSTLALGLIGGIVGIGVSRILRKK